MNKPFSTEHELQQALTQHLRSGGSVIINDESYFLVCWELMFPSWEINDNKSKWNQVSIDFITTNGHQKLLCLELKNKIRNQNELFSAWCQAQHRCLLFQKQYERNKLELARQLCLKASHEGRTIETDIFWQNLELPDQPQFECAIGASEFPPNTEELLTFWNQSDSQIIIEILNKSHKKKECGRLLELFTSTNSAKINVHYCSLSKSCMEK